MNDYLFYADGQFRWKEIMPVSIIFGSVIILGIALIAQYSFGLEPCALCIYQRIPYGINLILAIVTLLLSNNSSKFIALLLCAIIFIAGSGIALHHVGVEQKWWQSSVGCHGEFAKIKDIDALWQGLLAPSVNVCSEVAWAIFDVSASIYNFILSIIMACFTLIGCVFIYRRDKTHVSQT
mgnify:CR=1 FL=1